MRDAGDLLTHLAQPVTTMAVCWRIETTGGEVFGFTTCSHDIEIGGLLYKASGGMQPTAVQSSIGLSVDNGEVAGFLNASVLPALRIRAGVFDNAKVYEFIVDYETLDGGQLRMLWGTIGEITRKGVSFSAEIRGSTQLLAAQIVQLTQATCRNEFGDAKCKAVPGTNSAAVSSVPSSNQLVASALVGARADGFFNGGYLTWTSGQNDGLRFDVVGFTSSSGTIKLAQKFVLPVANGDTFTIREGCLKTVPACKAKSNILNLNAEPYIPGNDTLLRVVRSQ
jgi:uncharacterized phage protein (TIGR02218 family)